MVSRVRNLPSSPPAPSCARPAHPPNGWQFLKWVVIVPPLYLSQIVSLQTCFCGEKYAAGPRWVWGGWWWPWAPQDCDGDRGSWSCPRIVIVVVDHPRTFGRSPGRSDRLSGTFFQICFKTTSDWLTAWCDDILIVLMTMLALYTPTHNY